jgi:FlaA1/EpsC-like NDP-sugar epimerase
MNVDLSVIGREKKLFVKDIDHQEQILGQLVRQSSFLIIGGAGTIGQAVTKEIFKRDPSVLHVVDISENNLVELVRDLRSSIGYSGGDFQALPLDCGSIEFDAFLRGKTYDYVLNLSALKHVRTEKDPFSLMRMIQVNIFNTVKTLKQAVDMGARKYFCVSTDKAANPVNMMGGSKRIMEKYLMRYSDNIAISTARFANVAFSDGSLLHGFLQRINKRQPISAPNDVRRYFITPQESGELCMLSCLLGENRDIFFPKLSEELNLITFSEIATRFLTSLGLESCTCETENEARARVDELAAQRKWPCYFFSSDTTGEKDFEEFFMQHEKLELGRFNDIGIVKNEVPFDGALLILFEKEINNMKERLAWRKEDLVSLFEKLLPEFSHEEKGKSFDNRM